MTTSIKQELAKRTRPRKSKRLETMAGDLVRALLEQASKVERVQFPSAKYRKDPVAFCREILGVEPWSKQIEILEAVRDNMRVAVSSCHKAGKSFTAAVIALHYFCSYPDARVVMSSTTARQVDQVLYRQLKMILARAGRCIDCKAKIEALVAAGVAAIDAEARYPRPCPHSALIEGELGELARTGLKTRDFREIVGFTAREAEAVAGISGRHLLYIIDEASGVPQEIFDAIEGNRAGGARILLISNPTRNSGEFHSAFHDKKDFYKTIKISALETPNYIEGRDVIPGLASRSWVEEKRQEWGEESPLFKVRVLGEFATREDGKIFSLHSISEAESRWADTPDEGRLFIGVDPAGPTGSGDETVFAVRRGKKLLALYPHRGLNEEAHLVQLLGLLATQRRKGEVPVVVLDREGSVGAGLYGLLRNYSSSNPQAFQLVAVRASDKASRQPQVYDRMRDELVANLEAWFRDGGAIVSDAKLAAELHAYEYIQTQSGRLKVTSKEDLRKSLGRSPDRFDALALSCWEPLYVRDGVHAETLQKVAAASHDVEDVYASRTFDPWEALKAWRR